MYRRSLLEQIRKDNREYWLFTSLVREAHRAIVDAKAADTLPESMVCYGAAIRSLASAGAIMESNRGVTIDACRDVLSDVLQALHYKLDAMSERHARIGW